MLLYDGLIHSTRGQACNVRELWDLFPKSRGNVRWGHQRVLDGISVKVHADGTGGLQKTVRQASAARAEG